MSDHIPSGVIAEILGRLSPLEVRRLRCVSKEWRSIIDDPDLIQRQLLRFTSLFVISSRKGPSFHRFKPGTFGPSRAPLDLTHDWGYYFPLSMPSSLGNPVIIGSCHGLLCLGYSRFSLLLFNPAFPEDKGFATLTNFMRAEPLFDNLYENDAFGSVRISWDAYGFGYDKVADDYKAVIFVTVQLSLSYVLTYSFNTRSFSISPWNQWRLPLESCPKGVLLRGALHWVAGSYNPDIDEFESDLIYSYDLGSDSISELGLPDYCCGGGGDNPYARTVGVLDSCLAVYATFKAGGRLDVWVMKEYGKENSWCRLHSLVNPDFDGGDCLTYSGTLSGHILMSDETKLMWVDPSSGSVQVVHRRARDDILLDVHLCLESPVKVLSHGEALFDDMASEADSDYDDLSSEFELACYLSSP